MSLDDPTTLRERLEGAKKLDVLALLGEDALEITFVDGQVYRVEDLSVRLQAKIDASITLTDLEVVADGLGLSEEEVRTKLEEAGKGPRALRVVAKAIFAHAFFSDPVQLERLPGMFLVNALYTTGQKVLLASAPSSPPAPLKIPSASP